MQINLDVITQEKQVFSDTVAAVTAPASEGEVTILPEHVPLFTKLKPGELRILRNGRWQVLAVAGGFMDVAPKGKVTILADSAVRVSEINLVKAESAKRRAQKELKNQKLSAKELSIATSNLRRATLELGVARKYRRRASNPANQV